MNNWEIDVWRRDFRKMKNIQVRRRCPESNHADPKWLSPINVKAESVRLS